MVTSEEVLTFVQQHLSQLANSASSAASRAFVKKPSRESARRQSTKVDRLSSGLKLARADLGENASERDLLSWLQDWMQRESGPAAASAEAPATAAASSLTA